MTKTHKVDYRVYYEDTDAGGIMYHANYICFCERGRSELLRDIGFPASEVKEKLNVSFVVRHLDADYFKMVTLDSLLSVQTSLKTIKNTSFLMEQVLICQNVAVFKMDVTLVCVDEAGKPTRIPEILRNKFKEYLKQESE